MVVLKRFTVGSGCCCCLNRRGEFSALERIDSTGWMSADEVESCFENVDEAVTATAAAATVAGVALVVVIELILMILFWISLSISASNALFCCWGELSVLLLLNNMICSFCTLSCSNRDSNCLFISMLSLSFSFSLNSWVDPFADVDMDEDGGRVELTDATEA